MIRQPTGTESACAACPGGVSSAPRLTTVINTFGGEWFNMKWEPQLTSPAFEKAVNFYVNLIRKSGEPGATSSGFTECETAMAQGKTSMWVDATVAAGQLTDPTKSQVAKDIGFAYAPTEVTPLGSHWLWSWSLAVEASSKQQDAAFKFLTWATSKDYIKLRRREERLGLRASGHAHLDLPEPQLQEGRRERSRASC